MIILHCIASCILMQRYEREDKFRTGFETWEFTDCCRGITNSKAKVMSVGQFNNKKHSSQQWSMSIFIYNVSTFWVVYDAPCTHIMFRNHYFHCSCIQIHFYVLYKKGVADTMYFAVLYLIEPYISFKNIVWVLGSFGSPKILYNVMQQ